MTDQEFLARGRLSRRVFSTLFLLPAWFSPHYTLRNFFHRLRGVRVGKGAEIGYFCILGNVHPGMISIGEGAVIAAGAALLEHDNSLYFTRGGEVRFGRVTVERKAFVGVHSVVASRRTNATKPLRRYPMGSQRSQ